MRLRSICGVILVSESPARLAEFYARVLGVELTREDHGGLSEHFGVDIGAVHFGIHPPANFEGRAPRPGSTVIAFDVESLDPIILTLKELGSVELAPPHDEGFGTVARYLDPDGNAFEIVELRYDFGSHG